MTKFRPTALLGALAAGSLLWVGCMGEPEPDGAYLSFLKQRERWQATTVAVTVTETAKDQAGPSEMAGPGEIAVSDEIAGPDEIAVSIVATDEKTGETLTFLVLTHRLEGSHPIKVFGNLADSDSAAGRERLVPVSNACTPGDRSLTTGTLSFEAHDPDARTLSGSFISNVCRVDDADRVWTLADGKFRELVY